MFTLIELPYAPDALEPVISARTLEFHHGKHLQGYVDNLNKLLPGSGLEELPLEEIVKKTSGALFNNAGQILNHNLYFTQFKTPGQAGGDDASCPAPTSPSCPASTGHLVAQIEKQWGSLDAFKAEFEAKGVGLFGSGWVWLSAAPDGTLVITQEPGASNPITRVMPGSTSSVMPGSTGHLKPLLTFDVWEHAYYLDYQNRRAAHLKALWDIVNWEEIERRYLERV